MKITLHGHTIALNPPQRLLMIEATRRLDGTSVKIIHASGDEMEGDFKLVSRSVLPPKANEASGEEEEITLPLPSRYFAGLPKLKDIDLWSPPAQYRTMPHAAVGQFEFNPGEQYLVVILGNGSLVQVTLVA